MANLRVTVSQGLCIGSGDCVGVAPKVFEIQESGRADVLDPSADTEENIIKAAEACPETAIKIEDADTGEQIFP